MANGSSDVSRGTVRPGKRILVADELIGQKIKIARREAGIPQEGLFALSLLVGAIINLVVIAS